MDDIGRHAAADAHGHRRAVLRLDAFLAEQLREQQASARRAIQALQTVERREELERDLSRRLAGQLASIRTSALVRRFVIGDWARVLADSIIRFGEKEEPTAGHLRTVDELLWTLRVPDHPQSRQRLIALLPRLLPRLRAGMAQIGMGEPDQRLVLDELMVVHTEALKPGARPDAGEVPTPEQIVQRLRDEVLVDLPDRPAFADSLIDLSSLDTVPADLLADGDEPVADPARRVDALAPGARLRLFVQGRWTRAQLLWRSPRGELFLFVGETVDRRHSLTRRALERLTEEGLAPPMDDPSLMQRAVDRMLRRAVT